MQGILVYILGCLVIGVSSGILANYLIDAANNIPTRWKPACSACGKSMTLRQYLLGENCTADGCKAKRRVRYFLLILVDITFLLISWGDIDLQHLGTLHFFAITNYFVIAVLMDILYRKTPTWFILLGVPLAISVGAQFELTVGQIMVGGAISMIAMGIWYAASLKRYEFKLKDGLEASKPNIDTVSLAAVSGMIVGFPKVIFTLLMVFYFTAISGVLATLFRLNKPVTNNTKMIPMAVILVIGTVLTMLIFK